MSKAGFDATSLPNPHEMIAEGYHSFGFYLRPDRAPKSGIDALLAAGIKLWSIWERGNPTTTEYFSTAQGTSDGQAAAMYALELGQPSQTQIFACFDYDPTIGAIEGPLRDYMEAFREAIRQDGYWASAYGSGTLLQRYIGYGIAHSGWLSQSKGFSGYETFKPSAAIIQGPSKTICGLGADADTVVDESVLWTR